jgi:hypothetical protein
MSRQKFPYCHDFAGASIMDLITKESHKYDISYPAAAALLLLLLLRCCCCCCCCAAAAALHQKSYGQLIILASYAVFRLLVVADGKH